MFLPALWNFCRAVLGFTNPDGSTLVLGVVGVGEIEPARNNKMSGTTLVGLVYVRGDDLQRPTWLRALEAGTLARRQLQDRSVEGCTRVAQAPDFTRPRN